MGPLGDRHQHDVHDDDSADHDADGNDGGNDREENTRQVLPEFHQCVRRLDRVIGLVSRPQMVRYAHRFLGPLHSTRDEVGGWHLDRDIGRLAPAEEHLEVRQRQQDKAVERLPKHTSLFGDRANDSEPLT